MYNLEPIPPAQEYQALPPWVQEDREKEAIIQLLKEQHNIDCSADEIIKIAPRSYEIPAYEVIATIVPIGDGKHIGPLRFVVEFQSIQK